MVRANLKGVNRVRKSLATGEVVYYHYHRATGRRLHGEPGSAEFVRDYAEAEKSVSDRLAGTFVQLIRDYLLSPEFERRAESTQREYRRMLTKAEAEFGDMPIPALQDARVRKDFLDWGAAVARTSGNREADNRLSVISAMLSWAKDNGRLATNHLAGFKRLHKVDRSELIWLPEHIDAFMNSASLEMQRALILALHSGQRQGDLLKLAWNNYDGSFLTLRQGKTGRKVDIPCTVALKRMLDGMNRSATVVLTTTTGRPWTARHFKAQWHKAAIAAGINHLLS